ncbi:aminoglycoside phosphotransferase family protein [Mucilaginibacter sp.]|uniref:phosphotransferase enzyme family protein n=1 Tax=Mucilaginibacter sp. TaxID=1882438 RepID=UPI002611606A|nr:aminoglycoside phosphotransferase family protein [Mucilaginibacter sp.]
MIQAKKKLNLLKIASNFIVGADVASIEPYGSGHINDTYYINNTNKEDPGYLLQRINHRVFKDIPSLINNIHLVTNHLRSKLKEIPGADPDKEVLSLVMTNDHSYYFSDERGNYWRMYKYLKNTKSIDIVQTNEQAFEGGKAFGKFQMLLFDLDINLLNYTIPAFHHIGLRLTRLNTSLQTDPLDRKKTVAAEVEFIQHRVEHMCAILNLGREGGLPLRITHNDTKFNNILLDENDQAQCVIDLDTVMPGYVAYDFGDAIRSIINTAPEDEADLNKISLNIPLFEAFTRGYLQESAGFLTENEIRSLPLSVLLFPYMQGVRFLTDYLNGDVYYKTHVPDHNLQRARAQFQLLRKLEEQYAKIEGFIWQAANTHLNKDINTNRSEAV